MTIWHHNLETLREVSPDLAAILLHTAIPEDYVLSASKAGPNCLQVGKQKLHSAYDPVKEGEDWAAAQNLTGEEPVVVFGLGLGYHLLPWLERDQHFYVVEPSTAVARLALEMYDFTPLLQRRGLRLGRNFHDLPRPARLLSHPATRRLHPQLHHRLSTYLAGQPDSPGPLRILVVSPLYGGSHPLARYAVQGFRQLGHAAELLDFAPFHPACQALPHITVDKAASSRLFQDLQRLLGEVLLNRVRDFCPDLVFFLAQAPVDPVLLRTLKSEGPLLAYWFVEDFQVFPYWRDLAPEVDVFFILQQEPFLQELRNIGVKQAAFLPLAANPEVYRPLDLTPAELRRFGSALSFVGAGYPNRQEFMQGLLDFDLKIWGSDWKLPSPLTPVIQDNAARVVEADIVKIFNASRINLNLHSSPFHQGINPDGDYLNPRIFDLAAAGAFQLVDWRAQLPGFFSPDQELATFRSLAEAREKIDYYLAHPEERQFMARQGRERCLRDHTMSLRLAQALEMIADFFPGVLPQRQAPAQPGLHLAHLFPADHPVQTVLQRLPLAEITNLGDVVEHLQTSSEPLSEPEAIFWLLHEFHQGLQRGRF